MRDIKMNSSRQSNQANLGFYPTDLEVVKLEMELIDFSDLANRDIELNICDLTGGTGDQLDLMHGYLNNKCIESNVYYNELNFPRYESCVTAYPYMHHLNCDVNNLKIGSKKNNQLNKKVFNIVRNNPPYGFDSNGIANIRLEKKIFDINATFDMPGAIQFFELPITQIDRELLNAISYRYEIKAFKFPVEEFADHKQVCMVLKKKTLFNRDKNEIDKILDDIANDTMMSLDQVNSPVFSLTYEEVKNTEKIHYFRTSYTNALTLKAGAEQVWGEISSYHTKKGKRNVILKEKPIIELLQGHVASLLASGRYNGILGDLLIAGGSEKTIKVTTEYNDEGLEVKTEIESLQPYLEVTNKDGDILYKNF